jgi:DNA-directed RNA polymerase subunit E'/Rpb7
MLESALAIFEETVPLTAADLGREIKSIDDVLMKKLRSQIEGRCSKHGYLKPGTLEFLSSAQKGAEKGRFTGDFMYQIKAQGRVYNPPDGCVVEGEVIRKNKMGLYVIVEDAIKVMIPRDLHIGNEDFDTVELGETIRVEIKKSQFQMNETHILTVGQYLGRTAAAPGAPPVVPELPASASASAEAEEAEEEEAEAEEEEAEEAEEAEAEAEEAAEGNTASEEETKADE